MKKLIALFALILVFTCTTLLMVSCNYQVIDLNYKFDYAYIYYGDGTVEKVEISSWRDYEDGDQIQIIGKDGTVYLVHSENCTLVKEAK